MSAEWNYRQLEQKKASFVVVVLVVEHRYRPSNRRYCPEMVTSLEASKLVDVDLNPLSSALLSYALSCCDGLHLGSLLKPPRARLRHMDYQWQTIQRCHVPLRTAQPPYHSPYPLGHAYCDAMKDRTSPIECSRHRMRQLQRPAAASFERPQRVLPLTFSITHVMPRSFYSFLLRSQQDVVYVNEVIEAHNRRHDVGDKLAPAYALVYRGCLFWRIFNHGGERLSTAFIDRYIRVKQHDTTRLTSDTALMLLMWPFATPDMLRPASVLHRASTASSHYDEAWSNPPFTHLFFDHRMHLALASLPTSIDVEAFNTHLHSKDPHLWHMVTSPPPSITPRDILAQKHDCMDDAVGRGLRISHISHRIRFGLPEAAKCDEHKHKTPSSELMTARQSVDSGFGDVVNGSETRNKVVAQVEPVTFKMHQTPPPDTSFDQSDTSDEEMAQLLTSLRFSVPTSTPIAVSPSPAGTVEPHDLSVEGSSRRYDMPLAFACNVCGKITGYRCSGCMTTFFCSLNCQAADERMHVVVCAVIREAKAMEAH